MLTFSRAEGFSCCLDMSKLQFLIEKRYKTISAVFFFFTFWSSKPWIRIGSGSVSGSTWNAGSGSVNPDPQFWAQGMRFTALLLIQVQLADRIRITEKNPNHCLSHENLTYLISNERFAAPSINGTVPASIESRIFNQSNLGSRINNSGPTAMDQVLSDEYGTQNCGPQSSFSSHEIFYRTQRSKIVTFSQ